MIYNTNQYVIERRRTILEYQKEQQKNEAINRLRLLQMNFELLENVVTEFEQDDILYYSEYINKNAQGILYYISNSEELTNQAN